MKKTVLLFIFLFQVSIIIGQSINFPEIDEINLHTVYAIKNDLDPDGWIKILTDNTGFLSGTTNTATWTSTGNVKPAAYVSGTTGVFGADFIVTCEGDALYVRGECSNGKHLPVQKIEPFASFYRYKKRPLSDYDPQSNSYSDSPFKALTVQYWKDFEIQWFISNDPDLPHEEWVRVETSKHPLYVTHSKPIANDGNPNNGNEGDNPLDPNDRATEILLTTLHTACKAANSSGDESQIVSLIYDAFTDLCVKRVNNKAEEIGNCLGYWQPPNDGPCATVSAFLINGNARCNEWADFFNDMIKIQGIETSKVTYMEYTENHTTTEDIENDLLSAIEVYFNICLEEELDINETVVFVNNFNFNSDLLYVDEFAPDLTLCNGTMLTNANAQGVPAQGVNNSNPQSVFYDHVIVQYRGFYFDPSYGSEPKNSKISYEDSAFAGFGAIPFLTYTAADGVMYDEIFLYLHESNTQGDQQIIFNP